MKFTLKNNKGAIVAKGTFVKPESKRLGLVIKKGLASPALYSDKRK
jgi:hypothetical protein